MFIYCIEIIIFFISGVDSHAVQSAIMGIFGPLVQQTELWLCPAIVRGALALPKYGELWLCHSTRSFGSAIVRGALALP